MLYSFGGSGDGVSPLASLLDVKGTLYGTTHYGGLGSCSSSGYSGCGTVFAITSSGKESVLYSFKGGSGDGEYPTAGLINVGGKLYGTTLSGGPFCSKRLQPGCGTVFSVTPSGKETVLYTFKGHPGDGNGPAALVNVNGTLYGTTYRGGATNDGTIFSLTPSGTETVLYSFVGDRRDGAAPLAALVNVDGKLYGTTSHGGVYDKGTVFSVSTSGNEKVLHSFGGSGDGGLPMAALIDVNGTLYGTTSAGGHGCHSLGCGTVFSLTP